MRHAMKPAELVIAAIPNVAEDVSSWVKPCPYRGPNVSQTASAEEQFSSNFHLVPIWNCYHRTKVHCAIMNAYPQVLAQMAKAASAAGQFPTKTKADQERRCAHALHALA